jgi:hypothetical protein
MASGPASTRSMPTNRYKPANPTSTTPIPAIVGNGMAPIKLTKVATNKISGIPISIPSDSGTNAIEIKLNTHSINVKNIIEKIDFGDFRLEIQLLN